MLQACDLATHAWAPPGPARTLRARQRALAAEPGPPVARIQRLKTHTAVSFRTSYRRALHYFGRYRWALAAGTASVLLSRWLMAQAPELLRQAVNHLEVARPDAASAAVQAAWWFVGITAGSGVFAYTMRVLIVGTSRRVERDLKRDLFRHVQRLPASFFDRTRTGDLLARLTSDVEAVRFSLGPGLMYVAGTVVLFPLVVVRMMRISPSLAVAALVPLLLIMLVVRLLGPGIMRRTRAVQERIGDLSARAQESFAGARVVRAYATEPVEEAAFRRENEALVRETIGLARYRALMTAGLFALGGLAELAVIAYGGRQVIDGTLQRGDLVAFIAFVGLLIWPMISIGWVVSSFQRAAAAMERLNAVFDAEPEVEVHGTAAALEAIGGALRVRGLTFTYPGATQPALDDVSFDLSAGQTLALVGPVGAGKSTVLELLTRRYEPPPKSVYLDGIDVRTLPLDRLRRAFAVVPQDAFLFSDTLLANLAYAVEGELEPGRAHAALGTAGLAEDIAGFPKGLETVVGERGLMLSGGQKQRTTLARALLRDAPVLLLDDCLSAVDTETESRILDALRTELRRGTAVVVAHRLSTIRNADLVVVLDAGRVVESGTHESLLAAGGWYARTYEQQRLEAELEGLS